MFSQAPDMCPSKLQFALGTEQAARHKELPALCRARQGILDMLLACLIFLFIFQTVRHLIWALRSQWTQRATFIRQIWAAETLDLAICLLFAIGQGVVYASSMSPGTLFNAQESGFLYGDEVTGNGQYGGIGW